MKLAAKCVAGLLPLLLSGCFFHKANQAQVQQPALAPPIVDNPPPKPAQPVDTAQSDNLPPSVVTEPKAAPSTTTANAQPPPPPPKPKHRKPAPQPAAKPADQTQPAPQQVASNGQGSEVSAIGQLSTGDPGDVRSETESSIAATEKGLKEIGRKLNDPEQKTADQITEFLKEARQALTSGDVDGAHTLAAKAKVLLGELTK
jgi:outer membrane biosynthesis protein TonB